MIAENRDELPWTGHPGRMAGGLGRVGDQGDPRNGPW